MPFSSTDVREGGPIDRVYCCETRRIADPSYQLFYRVSSPVREDPGTWESWDAQLVKNVRICSELFPKVSSVIIDGQSHDWKPHRQI